MQCEYGLGPQWAQGRGFRLLSSDSEGAEPVKALVRQAYYRFYGAELHHFMPLLLWLEGSRTAVGLSPGSSGPMFLEHYLDCPIELALTRVSGREQQRSRTIELGNFAAGSVGETRLLIPMLAQLLYRLGYDWVVFTATPLLRNSFRRLGVDLIPLASADPARVPEPKSWGSYYDSEPQVLAGSIAQAMPGLSGLDRPVSKGYTRLPRSVEMTTPSLGAAHV